MRVLFVCTANKLRSRAAEDIFRGYPGIKALSAGTDREADTPLTAELVASVDVIFAMENQHREFIRRKFKKQRPADNRIYTLNIPDEYKRGDEVLIAKLKDKVEWRLESLLVDNAMR